MPIWWVMVLLAIAPALAGARILRRKHGDASTKLWLPRPWAVSLLIALAIGAWWLRGYWLYDEMEFPHTPPGNHFSFRTNRGLAQFQIDLDWPFREHNAQWGRRPLVEGYYLWADLPDDQRFAGFGYYRKPWHVSLDGVLIAGNSWLINTPLAAMVLLAMVLPAVRAFKAYRGRRARRAGRCTHCGYDLRASPQRCPECGTIPVTTDQISQTAAVD